MAHIPTLYGVRKTYTFIEAATKYLKEESKKSIDRNAISLKAVMPFIGGLPLEQVHLGTLEKQQASKCDY